MRYTRREFIKTSAAISGAVGVGGVSKLAAAQAGGATSGTSSRLETFSEWLRADREARKRGLEACLQRIRELEPKIHAWVVVQPEQPTGDGPLSGIPFGVKDIVETKGMATEYGSPLYKGRVGTEDAAIIRQVRGRGAVLLGKTVTTAFAYRTPGPTRNPRNLEHTPGGSSSGSAAAVAAGMVPFTIGEQTRGSMCRPASFCGVTGFKPTHDLLAMEGVLPVAKSLDTLGLFTHTPVDMLAWWKALGYPAEPAPSAEKIVFAFPEPLPECEPEMANGFRQSIALLRKSGVSLKAIDIAGMLKEIDKASDLEMTYEGARYHEPRLKEFGSRLDEPLANLIRDGLTISDEKYAQVRKTIADGRARFAEIFKSTPVILTPAAPGPAPLGLSTTGDPRMNAPWTALGTPAMSMPMPVGDGLPLGLQLSADVGQDAMVLHAGVFLQQRFDAGPKITPA